MNPKIKQLIENLESRLQTYPGAHEGEAWKMEPDPNKCTSREKNEILRYTLMALMAAGLTRGEVHHVLFGYRHAGGHHNGNG